MHYSFFLSVIWEKKINFFYLSVYTSLVLRFVFPLCSCKPALHDLILNIASGFSSFHIRSSLTFYCGSLALCLFLFHWKPNSHMQQICRHSLVIVWKNSCNWSWAANFISIFSACKATYCWNVCLESPFKGVPDAVQEKSLNTLFFSLYQRDTS